MKPIETALEGASGGPRYRFGEVVVDEAAHTLVRSGVPQTVEPKAFAVLLVLLRRADELVGRDELLDAVWGHRHVTPGVLTRAIAQLRSALGDDFHHPIYIQTQHALGYRFIGSLEPETVAAAPVIEAADTDVVPAQRPRADDPVPMTESAAATVRHSAEPFAPGTAATGNQSSRDRRKQTELQAWPPARVPPGQSRRARGWVIAVLALAAVAATATWLNNRSRPDRPAESSIAVLPFTSLSSARDDRYFAEGLAVEMHDALAGVPGLEVIAARPSAKGVGSDIDVKKLGRRLGVATVLDASVRREGSRVRINARLSDTRTGVTLWAGSYDRNTADVFALQSEIANEVVQALLGMLPGGGQSLAKRLAPTHNIVAYDAYLKGLQQLQELGNGKRLDTAIGYFREALTADPVFARAQAGICRAEIAQFESALDAPAFERAQAACTRASSMDPGLREVSLALGEMYRARGDATKAIEQYTKALDDIALRPAAYVGLARTEGAQGRNEIALDYFQRALKLRPGDANTHRELGLHQYVTGDLKGAIGSFETATTLQPDDDVLWSSLGGLYLVSGDTERAGKAFERSLEIKPNYPALSNFGSLKYEAGEYVEAADLYRHAAELDPEDFRIWGNIGDALSALPATASQAREPYRRAADMAERYVDIKSGDAQAFGLLAWYRANLGETNAARELLARAEAMGTERGEIAFWGAQTLALIGDTPGARNRVAQARAADIPMQRIQASPLLRRLGNGGQAGSSGHDPSR
jgi:TolB-like protein/Flp pilus assembly protein TadD/DNA-binding winged helix-turn-helix (wHTH) protein